jgi:hypothetical protein
MRIRIRDPESFGSGIRYGKIRIRKHWWVGYVPQINDGYRGPTEIVQHFPLQGEFTSAHGGC